MGIGRAFTEGLARTARMPGLILLLFLFGFAIALPVTAVMSRVLDTSLGASTVADNLRQGMDLDWLGEFQSGRTDIGTTFTPSIIGAGAILNNIELVLDGSFLDLHPTVLGVGIFMLIAWTFFGGGIIALYRQDNGWSGERLAAAGARYFFRFLQLLVLSGVFYFLVYRFVGRPLLKELEPWTRDWTSERPILFLTMVSYALVFALLGVIHVVFDYARIHTVLEDRRNMAAAALQGLLFVIRRPRALGLFCMVCCVSIAAAAVYTLAAPGPSQSNVATVLLAFLFGQLYLLSKVWIKVLLLASQTVLMASYERQAPAAPIEEPMVTRAEAT